MKVIFLVVALSAAAMTAPAENSANANGESNFDGNLKFNLSGDSTFKNKFEALVKPFADFLKGFGLNGEIRSEGDAKGGGQFSGDFNFGGKRSGNRASNIKIPQAEALSRLTAGGGIPSSPQDLLKIGRNVRAQVGV